MKSLAPLARLRRLATAAARADLTRAVGVEREADAAVTAIDTALTHEAAAHPAALAAWLPHALAQRATAQTARAAAAHETGEASATLAERRLAERALETLAQARADLSRQNALRRAQHQLDEQAAAPATPDGRTCRGV